MEDVGAVIDRYTGRARKVLEYSQVIKALIDGAPAGGLGSSAAAYWAPLATLVETGGFERVGNFKEVMSWEEYTGFLGNWAPHAQWECLFKRVSEVGEVVFLELEERTTMGGVCNAVNSLSVYEFTPEDRIRHIDIYLQMPMPDLALLQGYEGINISS